MPEHGLRPTAHPRMRATGNGRFKRDNFRSRQGKWSEEHARMIEEYPHTITFA